MKVGDKMVCINDGCGAFALKKNQICTIFKIYDNGDIMVFEELAIRFNPKKFVTLQQFRKMKLNKLKDKIYETR